MEDYLLDRETLGKFIDELMKKRPLPLESAEELSEFREQQIKSLDDQISQAIIGSLDDSQTAELSQLLNNETENSDVFRDFFEKHHIDVEGVITDAASAFSANFLAGGQNE